MHRVALHDGNYSKLGFAGHFFFKGDAGTESGMTDKRKTLTEARVCEPQATRINESWRRE
ncbi:MAG: hypothetical protein IKS96_07795 [Fibrobacter sp.]|nr:hypothetical protein [Fibrobacter sp.]